MFNDEEGDRRGLDVDHWRDSEPANTVFQFRSTQAVPPADRLDYWRQQFSSPRIFRPVGFRSSGFDGRLIVSRRERDVIFGQPETDPVNCRFGERDADLVLLGHVYAGRVGIAQRGNKVATADAEAGLLEFDCTRVTETLSTERYGMRYLALPRALASEILGVDAASLGRVVTAMPSGRLEAVYLKQLQWMGRHGPELGESEALYALSMARALAVTILAGLKPHWRSLPHEFDGDLLLAARWVLTTRIDDFNFTTIQLAATMRCSRAHLYRLFEQAGIAVSDELHELRMQRASKLLASGDDEPVGMIALHCGYTDLAAFGKAFHRCFGCTPTVYRHCQCDPKSGAMPIGVDSLTGDPPPVVSGQQSPGE